MPRFTLRDLFWLTLVVALGVGWWVRQSAADRRLAAIHSALAHMSLVVVVTPGGEVTVKHRPQ